MTRHLGLLIQDFLSTKLQYYATKAAAEPMGTSSVGEDPDPLQSTILEPRAQVVIALPDFARHHRYCSCSISLLFPEFSFPYLRSLILYCLLPWLRFLCVQPPVTAAA